MSEIADETEQVLQRSYRFLESHPGVCLLRDFLLGEEEKMKTMIAALAFVLLAAGPTFAAPPTVWQLQEARASTYVPFSGGYSPQTQATRR